jgi:two-component system response regulator WspF
VRIAIVNDLVIATEALRRVIRGDPTYSLAWTAVNGAEAVERCRRDIPDLILMDLMMPLMDGAEATRRIMSESPCAILVVTATLDGNLAKVFEALGAGALDAVQTPILGGGGRIDGAAKLIVKIEAMRRLIMSASVQRDVSVVSNSIPAAGEQPGLIAIGASAGGPGAIATILCDLPAKFAASIIVIQHLDAEFASSFAHWLDERCALPVRIAQEGDQPRAGSVLIAGSGEHLIFASSHSLGYTPEPRDSFCRPSVDVFFESVVRHWRGKVAGVLLTGMGKDGSRGLKSLRDAGALTIAQDAATCIVYGMPRAAAELGAASRILPLGKIAGALIDAMPCLHLCAGQRA